jgi:hypothetical protein
MKAYYEYYEYRPNHFVKLINGKVISKASRSEFIWEELDLDSIHSEYHEYRPNRFVKLQNGKVISKVSRVEIIWEELDLDGYTSTRNIAISIGLAALMWFSMTLIEDTLLRSTFIAGFISFSVLFFISLAAYTIPKMQLAGIEYIYRKKLDITSTINYFELIMWVLIIWLIRLLIGIKHQMYSEVENQSELIREFGLILLFWEIVLFWGIILPLIAFILIS